MKDSLFHFLQENTQVKYVSVDIFDTLIFRTVKRSLDVFSVMYSIAKDKLPDYIDAEEWRQIRVKAEKLALEYTAALGKTEITLNDIYHHMPHIIKEPQELQKYELEAEKEICVLNIGLYEELLRMKELGYGLILISDMYFSYDDICSLLKHIGVELSIFEHIYISSEYEKSKKTGELYEYILNELQLAPDELLHCGDNLQGDILQAKQRGILTYYYPIISEARYKYPFLDIEDLRYSDVGSEIFFLRNLVANENPYQDESKVWYEIGGMILGPLFACATEWVLDQAEENGIRRIYPLMREGKVLSRLLEKAVQFRQSEVIVEPLYVSRKAVFDSLKANISCIDIMSTYETVHYKVKDIFDFYCIADLAQQFETYWDYEISDLKKINISSGCVYDLLQEYLTSNQMVAIIRKRHSNAMNLIIKYFRQKNMDLPFIALDLGWHGRTGDAIRKILDIADMKTKFLNLFVCGKYNALTYVYEGTDIRGYVGNFGKNMDELSLWYAFIAEILCMCDEGTTIGYREAENGEVMPVCKEGGLQYKKQISRVLCCQEGIMKYQELYLKYANRNKRIANVKYKEKELCQIVARMHAMPTVTEARLLGSLEYDVNMGTEASWKIISPEVLGKYLEEDMGDFYRKRHGRNVEWVSGMNVLKEPFFYYRMQFMLRCKYYVVRLICFIEKILKQTDDKLILVGAGQYGRDIYKLLRIVGKTDQIEGYLDNNVLLHDSFLLNIPVQGIEYHFKSKHYVICTENPMYIKQLVTQIREKKGEGVSIYCYFEEE